MFPALARTRGDEWRRAPKVPNTTYCMDLRADASTRADHCSNKKMYRTQSNRIRRRPCGFCWQGGFEPRTKKYPTHSVLLTTAPIHTRPPGKPRVERCVTQLTYNEISEDIIKWMPFLQGEWVENRRHGFGVLQGHSGSAFHGEWRQDRKHGAGVVCPVLSLSLSQCMY